MLPRRSGGPRSPLFHGWQAEAALQMFSPSSERGGQQLNWKDAGAAEAMARPASIWPAITVSQIIIPAAKNVPVHKAPRTSLRNRTSE